MEGGDEFAMPAAKKQQSKPKPGGAEKERMKNFNIGYEGTEFKRKREEYAVSLRKQNK